MWTSLLFPPESMDSPPSSSSLLLSTCNPTVFQSHSWDRPMATPQTHRGWDDQSKSFIQEAQPPWKQPPGDPASDW